MLVGRNIYTRSGVEGRKNGKTNEAVSITDVNVATGQRRSITVRRDNRTK